MVTYSLMVVMIAVSLAALAWPQLAGIVGGVGELAYPWQPWTAAFVHGWPAMPPLLHLAGNLALLLLAGPPVEQQLGPRRHLLVTLAAIGAAGVVRLLTGLEINGASAFIWAYGPLLWLLVHNGKQANKAGVLWLMWLVVPLAMGIMLALDGVNFLAALVWGNVYHLSGTIVGLTGAWFWQRQLIELQVIDQAETGS